MLIKSRLLSEKIQLLLSPKVLCVFWITSEGLEQKPYLFEELDYYVDGLLSKHVAHFNTEDSENDERARNSKCLLGTTAFSHPFFIVHFHLDKNISNNLIEEIKSIIDKTKRDEYDHLVIIQPSQNKISNQLMKTFHEYHLETFNLEG